MRLAFLRPFLLLPLLGPALPAQNYLHTSGSRLVDSTGTTVRLTGLNWFGLETSNYCPHGLWSHSMAYYLDLVKAKGYNCLRLPWCNQLLDPGGVPNGIDFSQNPDLSGLTGLQIMDKLIAGCKARGIKVILDRHRPDSGAQSALWYTSTYPESRWIGDWKLLAQRYLGNDTVIGCDLHNEPHFPATWGDGTANDWTLAAQRCGNAILAVNPRLLIVVEGTDAYNGAYYWWGGNLAGAGNHPVRLSVPGQLVYSTHDYPASVYAQPWFSDPTYPANLPGVWDRNWGYLVRTGTAPVLLGEFGSRLQTGSDQQWFNTLASTIQGSGLSFTFWCLNPDSGDTGGLLADDWSTVIQAKQQVLAPLQAPFIGGGGPTPPSPPPSGVPAAPTGLAASAGDARVTLAWTASSGAATYQVYRATSAGMEGTLPLVKGLSGTSYADTAVANGIVYYYKVAAANRAGVSGLSAEAQAKPAATPTGNPVNFRGTPVNVGPWWGELDLAATATAPVTSFSLTVNLARTTGLGYGGMYDTVGGAITLSHSVQSSGVRYTFTLAPGQTLAAGTCTFGAQFSGTGTTHVTTGDSWSVAYTSGGRTYLQTGHF
jgi:aryl-phospho-beta-D-glucosidase BglC (GH1 family)